MAKFNPGDKVKYSAKFLKSAGMMSDRGRRGVIVDAPTGMPAGGGFVSVQWNDEKKPQPIKEMALMKTSASFKGKHRAGGSFKGAVPGNLSDNTKPSTPESQDYAVKLLKQGGVLPEDEKSVDYPVLTARVKRDIIATLLRRKQPRLATWASRNLRTRMSATFRDGKLRCDMTDDCENPVTHMEGRKGYVYCEKHAQTRMRGGHRLRKLKPNEVKKLETQAGLGYAGLYVKA